MATEKTDWSALEFSVQEIIDTANDLDQALQDKDTEALNSALNKIHDSIEDARNAIDDEEDEEEENKEEGSE